MHSQTSCYRAQDRKLIVVDSEAEVVRAIFRRYTELRSVRLLQEELEARTSACRRMRGSKPFSRGALYLLLQNRVYRGEIVHKGQSHPGEHTPIIDQPLWDAVQARLVSNAAERNSGARTRQPSLLAGIVFDGEGNPMTPSHAIKKGRRYRGRGHKVWLSGLLSPATNGQRDDPKSGFPDRAGEFPDPPIEFPVTPRKFPVPMRRESLRKSLYLLRYLTSFGGFARPDEFAHDSLLQSASHANSQFLSVGVPRS